MAKVKKMAEGGEPLPPPPDEVELPKEWFKKKKHMASGGSASSRADGIAQRGKTKGTIVMCGGGMYKGKK